MHRSHALVHQVFIMMVSEKKFHYNFLV